MKSDDSTPSLPVKETTGVRTDLKTIGIILAAVVAATAAITGLKSSNAGQGEKLAEAAAIVRADHDIVVTHTSQIEQLSKALDRMDRKLDYLTGARSERPPAGIK